MEIKINNQTFILHYLGGIFWEEKKTLLISDVHFGKVSHFRKHGIAIPTTALFENFEKLNLLINFYNPAKIIFLGDLFHSSLNMEWALFAEWKATIMQEVILIEGNHDIINKGHYSDLNIEVFSELIIDQFLFTHHPNEQPGYFNFCGHVHPGIKLRGFGRQFLKLSCYFKKPNQLILPAFGAFTGKHYLVPSENDLVYGIADGQVFKVGMH